MAIPHLVCNIITPRIRELADIIGESPAYTTNLISAWQTYDNTRIDKLPTAEELKDFRRTLKNEISEIELNVPDYITDSSNTKTLARTVWNKKTSKYEIHLKPLKDLNEFFRYILGQEESPTSTQKREVFNRLEKEGYTIAKLKTLLSYPNLAYKFLLWHEMSHVQNDDMKHYFDVEKSKYPDYTDKSEEEKRALIDYLTEDKVEIEYRATLDALKKVEKYHQEYSEEVKEKSRIYEEKEKATHPNRTKLVQLTAGYFEGSATLQQEYPNVTDEQVDKLADFIMGFGNLSEQEATEILNVIEAKNNLPNYYEGLITPDENTIFVFGSNPEGRHGAGAAKVAHDKFGAEYGIGEGMTGNAYALPTKDLRVTENKGLRSIPKETIVESIKNLYQTARENPNKQFKVAYTNKVNETTLNGYTGGEMIDMFLEAAKDTGIPSNIIFSKQWVDSGKFGNVPTTSTTTSTTSKMPAQSALPNVQAVNPAIAALLGASLGGSASAYSTPTNVEVETYEMPKIGTRVLSINKNSKSAKLARDFTPTQRLDRSYMIAGQFTNTVDRMHQEAIETLDNMITNESMSVDPDLAEIQRLNENKRKLTDIDKGRFNFIKDNITFIFETMLKEYQEYADMSIEDFEDSYGEGNGEYFKDAYTKIVDNFEALLDDACLLIEANEGIRLMPMVINRSNGATTEKAITAQATDTEQNSEYNESQLADDDGERVTGNGGWSFQVRMNDPHTSLSKDTKKVLGNIKKEGYNGEIETDDLGYTRYINEEYAHAILINELANMIDANDFSRKIGDNQYQLLALDRITNKYPWVRQVITELESNPRLISRFFADFRKDFIPYWMQREGKTIPLNKTVAQESTLNNLITNYEQGTVLTRTSLYDKQGNINKNNIPILLESLNELTETLESIDIEDTDVVDSFSNKLNNITRSLGFNVNSDIIRALLLDENAYSNLINTFSTIRRILNDASIKEGKIHLIETYNTDFTILANIIGEVNELDLTQSFRQGDKTRYSYSSPNYLNTMFKCFKSDSRRDGYLQDQYKKYQWFYQSGHWMNEWLRLIESDSNIRNNMELKELPYIVDSEEDPYERNSEYTQWTPRMIKHAFINEYFSAGEDYAFYNFPIFSDSPIAMFIKFKRYRTDSGSTFKTKLLPLFRNVVLQELSRIKLVQDRKKAGVTPIANFDKNGDKFHFFPSFNDTGVLEKCVAYQNAKDQSGLYQFIDSEIQKFMDKEFQEFIQNNINHNSLRSKLLDSGAITSEEYYENALEEYFWNQSFATSQIIQLTTTDLAFYKNGIDFQKRYKEVYAAGIKLNTNSQYGKEFEKTIYLKDQIITSSSYNRIKASLDKAVASGHIKSFDRDTILNKFKDINVADAQAYRSLKSMRSILDMIGTWTDDMQEAYDRIKSGEWDMSDVNVVWQTIKPFVFTQIEKSTGVDDNLIKVPHQNKNSEFLLLNLYQIIAASSGNSDKMKAINEFMEEKDIDVIQFESSVKAGKQGVIDLNYSEEALENLFEDENSTLRKLGLNIKKTTNFERFKKTLDSLLDKGGISQENYNIIFQELEPDFEETKAILERCAFPNGIEDANVVHSIPYADYVIQQPTPEHLFDVESVFGSQFRNLIVSDLPDDPNFRINVNGKNYTKQEVIHLYESCIVENLLEDFDKVSGRFSDVYDKNGNLVKEGIEVLQAALLEQIKGNPKYGRDMVNALEIVEITNPATGQKEKVFNIPLNNPSTTLKLQELITSMFKNAVTKQTIKGGACILVSSFGYTDELHVLRDENGTITGFECYLPAYSRQFYEPLMIEKTAKDGSKYYELNIKDLPEDLRRAVGFRIPTEAAYSMAPLIIKGFLPQQNGSAIMLPAETTQLAGEDYDVKTY